MTVARQTLVAAMSETELQRAVVELARRRNWLVYHTYRSDRSEPGWPDLALCRPPRLLLVELKTDKGRLTSAQEVWLTALASCESACVHVWRPGDWSSGEIEAALR